MRIVGGGGRRVGEGNQETNERRGSEERREKLDGGRYSPENAISERASAGGWWPREEEERVRSDEWAFFTDGHDKREIGEREFQDRNR